MGIGMVMNSTSPSRAPDKNQQVTFSVSFVDKVPCVRFVGISQGIRKPVFWVGGVEFHQALNVERVDIVRVQPRARAESSTEVLDELLESIAGRIPGV
jgi:hypothetical protein